MKAYQFTRVLSLVLVLTLVSMPLYGTGAAASTYGDQDSLFTSELSPGVNYENDYYRGGSIQRSVHQLTVDMNHADTSIALGIPSPLNRLTTTTQQAVANTYEGHYVVGAINGGFFNPTSRFPSSIVTVNNQLRYFGLASEDDDGPIHQSAAFGMKTDGTALIDNYDASLSVSINQVDLPVTTINHERLYGETVVYTPDHSESTVKANQYVTDVVITGASKNPAELSFGDTITGTVAEIARFGEGVDRSIPEDGFIISSHGQVLSDQLENVEVGDTVTLTAEIDDQWKQTEFMIATGPMLVKDGNVAISMNTESSFAQSRHPRTAIGVSKDGSELFMVTVDGRQTGFSDGSSLRDLANYLIELGADRAINLDGGGSTTMAARLPRLAYPVVVNSPSDGRERAVSTTLQVVSTEPPVRVDEEMIIIDEFEDVSDWRADTARASATLERSGAYDPVRLGNYSAKLDYDYSTGDEGTAAAYVAARDSQYLQGQPVEIGAWVFGDGNDHWLRGQISDRTGQNHTINFTAEDGMNWSGWRYVRADIPANVPHPISFNQIYVAQPNADKQGKGTIFIDQIEAIYDSSYHVERFSDIDSEHWAYGGVIALNDRHIITGFTDGSFQPGVSITRAQAATMLVRELGLDTENRPAPDFNDVRATSGYYDVIATVADEGLLTGKAEKTFAPNESLTRAEMAVIMQRAYNLVGETEEQFSDVNTEHWAHGAINTLAANDLAGGYPDGTFGPSNEITRAEFSVLMYRVIDDL
ncbi:S-layer homology domain-containing protein [Desertibacillus haloalkaliphilus]|uniref:S-layer homology domain-containing protein n=1 Tax=Desertibacillus haloalkaliphilus TaxID=1328930 RepID=UPI001C271C16|nr:S-layer homology domain-containing protein [Desertibacillus haloalkaliphilus]MBU8905965.1 S-layer homology domain-containing protein [Desertibacillus haloalkaliphilus]